MRADATLNAENPEFLYSAMNTIHGGAPAQNGRGANQAVSGGGDRLLKVGGLDWIAEVGQYASQQ